jgi:hypothetical protein
MSIATRDQRVRLYTYSDAGSNGIVSSTYTFSVERWARKESPTGREVLLAEASQYKTDAVFTFGDEVAVPSRGLLKHGDTYYEVRGILPRRATREIHVLSETIDVAQSGYTVVDA